MIRLLLLALAVMFAGTQAQAQAQTQTQTYPDRPIRAIIGFAPGGGTDLLLRALLPKVSELLGQQVIIESRPGAGGNLAIELVAKAPADGYMLLMGTPNLATNPSLYKGMTVDPIRDLAPISLVGLAQNVFAVHPSVPARTVAELVALAKSKPGKLNYASSGFGTSVHLAAELFKMATGTDIVHVPYKGTAPAMNDVLAGQTEMMFNVLPSIIQYAKSGDLRPLAVTGTTRSPALPDVPTMIEAGVPGYTATTWNGLLAPAGTPPAIIARLNDVIVRAIKDPAVQEGYARMGQDPAWSTPEEFATLIREETAKWSRVIKAANIEVQ